MPLAAYFRNVGAALFALLLMADFYWPTAPLVRKAAIYSPAVRVHSTWKLPEPVVFDTTQAVMAAAAPASWDINPPAPPATGKIPIDRAGASALREAFALMPPPDAPRAASVEQKKRQPVHRYAARGTRRYAPPHIVLAARQGPNAWFGFRYW